MSIVDAYINGFVKRAGEYGLNKKQIFSLFKQADFPADKYSPTGEQLPKLNNWVYNTTPQNHVNHSWLQNPGTAIIGKQNIFPRDKLFRNTIAPAVRDMTEYGSSDITSNNNIEIPQNKSNLIATGSKTAR